jgi:hypothetical protein
MAAWPLTGGRAAASDAGYRISLFWFAGKFTISSFLGPRLFAQI